MEKVSKNSVEVFIAGKNVTDDVSPFISRVSYTDRLESESDDICLILDDTTKVWQQPWYPAQGDILTVSLGYAGNMLDCGLFEIDQIELEIPPDTIQVKAIAAAITKQLRTRNSKVYEKQSLKKIAQHIATKNGLTLTGDTGQMDKINIDRKTQDKQTDISFLSGLAKEYGFIFSVRGEQLVLITPEELEAEPVVATLDRTEISKARFVDKTAHIYGAAVIAKRDSRTNAVKKWNIVSSGNTSTKDKLVIGGGRVESDAAAQIKAAAALAAKNREKITASLTVPGNPALVAGVNVNLTDFGEFSGKWHIVISSHDLSVNSGYITNLNLRKIVEI